MKTKVEKKTVTHQSITGRLHLGQKVACKLCNWWGGKALCSCGHEGDGGPSQHEGELGHGACMMPKCGCRKFTWRMFLPRYTSAVEMFKA